VNLFQLKFDDSFFYKCLKPTLFPCIALLTLSVEVTGDEAGVGQAEPLVRPGDPGLLGLLGCSGEFTGLDRVLDFREMLMVELVLLIICGAASFKSLSSLAAATESI